MPRRFICCFLLLALCAQTGCASIVSGRYQSIYLTSTPDRAAVAIDGAPSGYTPTKATLKRRDIHYLTFSKAGYLDENIRTKQGYNWWNVGNALFGGVVGIVIDFASGAVYTVEPKRIHATLMAMRHADAPPSQTTAAALPVPAAAPPRRQSYTDPATGVTYTPAE